MVDRKKRKVAKYRGSKTHGGGSMKKRRGAGHRGGRGRAGSGKRGDAKKPSYWKVKKTGTSGKIGFSSKRQWTPTTINVGMLNSMIDTLVTKGKATKKGDTYVIDLAGLKKERLLGGGIVTKKLQITVLQTTKKAEDKVKRAGGSLKVIMAAPVPSAAEADEADVDSTVADAEE